MASESRTCKRGHVNPPRDAKRYCLLCSTLRVQVYSPKTAKAWRGKNKDKIRKQQTAFHARNPKAANQCRKTWRANHPELAKQLGRDQQRKRTVRYGLEKRATIAYRSILKRKYGMTVGDYDALVHKQNNCCAVCGGDKPFGRGKRWHVDHDHQHGTVRGLLCARCNTAIGLLQDKSSVASAAANYLRQHGK